MKKFIASLLYGMLVGSAIAANQWKVDNNLSINFIPDNENQRFCLVFNLKQDQDGYVGLTFSKSMYLGDTVIMWFDKANNTAKLWDAYRPGINFLSSFPSPIQDTDPILKDDRYHIYSTNKKNHFVNINGKFENNLVTLKACRAYLTKDPFDFQVRQKSFTVHAFYSLTQKWFEIDNYKQPTPISSNASGQFVTKFYLE